MPALGEGDIYMQNMSEQELKKRIFSTAEDSFSALALDVFRYQHAQNSFYRSYCDLLRIDPTTVLSPENIPFLPIQFFKSAEIKTGEFTPELIFESSGTTGSVNSRHLVKEKEIYEESFLKGFDLFYGSHKNLCIIGLLPSYLERQNSSLVYMVKELIERSENPDSGFYLYDTEKLKGLLQKNEAAKQPTLLIGVTYALLDFAEQFPMPLQYTTIMETGGMKGRREELTRNEVHSILQKAFATENIHSEYGMTELLSQAYSKEKGIFFCPPWMRICLRSEDDPFDIKFKAKQGERPSTGAINIIDLANLYSCSFIATDDAGKLYADGSFELLGRLDNSDIRGCSLLAL